MSDSIYSKPSRPATRKLCPNQCGTFAILSQDGNTCDCPRCGIVR